MNLSEQHNRQGQFVTWLDTPVGPMTAIADDQALRGLAFGHTAKPTVRNAILEQAEAELAEYFAGERQAFSTPVQPAGTAFQQRVWSELQMLSCGRTCSYADIARAIGRPAATRAVGTANGANPIAIIIPCHRVVRTGGALGGYAGGLKQKQWILEHEARMAGARLFA